MHKPVVIIGIGEMAGVFARGLLRSGYPVYPVTRNVDLTETVKEIPEPEFVLVAVGENDLHATIKNLPAPWRDRIILLQNELLPRDWLAYSLVQPTIISVWFEKKKGQDVKVLLPSPTFGPHAPALKTALESIDIPCRIIDDEKEMVYELVRKNVYIVTTNVAGLETGGTVAELWQNHESLAREVAADVMDIQAWLVGDSVDRGRLIEGMLEAFEGDPDHKCMGRSAPARLQRALEHASAAGLAINTLKRIAIRYC